MAGNGSDDVFQAVSVCHPSVASHFQTPQFFKFWNIFSLTTSPLTIQNNDSNNRKINSLNS
jgi:hypothetical protein